MEDSSMAYEDVDPKVRESFERSLKRKDTTREKTQKKRAEKRRLWGEGVEESLCNALNSQESNHLWSTQGWPDATGRKRVDILGQPKSPKYEDYRILIEIERERLTCVRNVIKAWMYIVQEDSRPILFVHVFSPSFKLDRKVGREEAEFVGKQAQDATNGKLTYRPIQLERWPTQNGFEDIVKGIVGLVNDYQTE